jgi:predicted Zn finger-like uncharacterized protein
MASPKSQSVVIVCPHCSTRYQVPADTLGPKGRQVSCAHCGKAWQATAVEFITRAEPRPAPKPVEVPRVARPKDDDRMFDADAEAELDAAFAAEQQAVAETNAAVTEQMRSIEEIKAAIAPKAPATSPVKVDQAKKSQLQKAFDQRQSSLIRQLPLAKVRRTARAVGLATLVLMIGAGIAFRTDIVRAFPDLAGTYQALGLGVNIVGLEFRDVKTLVSLRQGADVMQIDARIYSVSHDKVVVPSVVVTLLNDEHLPLYEWSVQPAVQKLGPGEVIDFTTQLNAPPAGATRVRLTFTNGRTQADSQIATPANPEDTGP